jgi:hypothetical protein
MVSLAQGARFANQNKNIDGVDLLVVSPAAVSRKSLSWPCCTAMALERFFIAI